ncbi:TlpA disulfide reductase family protein [Tamlana sp. 2201CG12-4]|uniref:TlpA family protein disulfide reductase n=1 Tax=Tamlana sp. 2201CG12-4 TaxID=3112582 RepID=UPI002DBC1018|nr:TlpA disulfide reductase family protein [Tamlana sp. 2201CG12-4]MEC3906418.1 TlpA disulfide reductase family protein [Tamlana sp. 2201CG12-4]
MKAYYPLKTIPVLFIICFFFSQSIYAQWKYPGANRIQSEVIINYEIIYDNELTNAQKEAFDYYDNIVVVFNGSKMKEQKIYKNINVNSFVILDYDKEKLYRCSQSSKTSKSGIAYDFKNPNTDVSLQPEESKTILGLKCNKAIQMVKGLPRDIYYTKKLGLRYCNQYKVDGFLLEYPGYSKKYGHYQVVAKTIHHKKLDPSIFSLDDYKIYTKEEYDNIKNKSKERYAKARFENIGKPLKRFNMLTMEGEKLLSKDMKGEVIVLNFWFTTCPPCKKEIPQLNKLKEIYNDHDQKVNFIAIATDPEYRLSDFLSKKKFNYDIVPDGKWIADKFGVSAYPTNIVIDRKGTIQLFEIGYKSDLIERMTYQIDKALK